MRAVGREFSGSTMCIVWVMTLAAMVVVVVVVMVMVRATGGDGDNGDNGGDGGICGYCGVLGILGCILASKFSVAGLVREAGNLWIAGVPCVPEQRPFAELTVPVCVPHESRDLDRTPRAPVM